MLEFYEIDKLQQVAKSLLSDKENNYSDKEKDNEISWNESLFISQMLLHSKRSVHLNTEILDEEIKKYNDKNNTSVSKEVLEKKFWIRHILDEIKIPSLVFSFCKDLYKNPGKREKYENEQYFKELMFIGYLSNNYGYEDSRSFLIDINDFDKIYHNFKSIYPNILSKQKIEELLTLEKTDTMAQYEYLPFHLRNFPWAHKILANVWHRISTEDVNFINCIKKWLALIEQFGVADFINLLDLREQQNFTENAIKLLLAEKDLILDNAQDEYNKLICDFNMSWQKADLFLHNDKSRFKINYSDYFLLWCTYRTVNFRWDLLSQSCREPYLLLLESLLCTKQFYKNIKELLLPEEKRPYLFLQLLYSLENKHLEYLLNFIDEEDYGVVFYVVFIEHCFHKIISDQNELLKSSTISLLKEIMQLFVDKNFNSRFKYKTFSRILMWLCDFNSKVEKRFSITQKKEEIYNYHITLLQKSCYQLNQLDWQQLIDSFNREKDYTLPIHGVGISHFSYLFNILEIAKQQNNKDFILAVIKEIKNLYIEKILKCDKLFLTYEYKQIEHFDWAYFYNEIIAKGELEEFFNQTLNSFIVSESSTLSNQDLNRTNADRFKLLLKTLCLAYKKFSVDNKNNLEEKILSLLSHCFIDDKNSESVNIFAPFYESTYIEDVDIALFPLLVDVVNFFSKKNQEKFIELVLKGDFRLWFKAYNLITFEECKKQVEDFVKSNSFSEKIDEIFTIHDLIAVLINVVNSDLNKDLENLLFDKLEKNIGKKASKGHLIQEAYNTESVRLFLLFKDRDTEALRSYKFPYQYNPDGFSENNNSSLDSERIFYLALIDLENGIYDESNNKFQHLNKKYPENLKYKIYKFYAKSCELSKKECKKEIKELQEEQKKEIKNLINEVSKLLEEKDSYKYKDVLLLTKLRLYIADNDLNNARYFYQLFDPLLKKNLESSWLIINILLKNNMLDDAIKIYSNIDSKFQDKEEYKKLTKLLLPYMDEMVVELNKSYTQILGLSDENRFKILPGKINKHENNIGMYFLNEIKIAFKHTLDKIDLVEKISGSEKKLSEDNITDLLELQINGRLSMLGYKLDNQNRCGKSASGKNAGEIDLKIDFGDFSIIIEAVKYSRGSEERKKHIEKTFNYDSSRKYIYDLIYFDSDADFDDSWNNVKKDIQKAKYPMGYELLHEPYDLNSGNGTIKIARSEHNGELTYYHIMGNFRYASSKKKQEEQPNDHHECLEEI